jgi:DNA-binding response OmpR family regulator
MSLRVLIVDEDKRFTDAAAGYLESRAHLVVTQSDVRQAVATARHWPADLVIVSEELAETGIIEELRAASPRPAILLTGWMDRYDRIWRAWQRGGDELLMKPVFRSQELHQALVAALENAAAGARRKAVPVPA